MVELVKQILGDKLGPRQHRDLEDNPEAWAEVAAALVPDDYLQMQLLRKLYHDGEPSTLEAKRFLLEVRRLGLQR